MQLNIKLQPYEFQVLVQNNKNHVKSIIPVIYNLKSVGGKKLFKKNAAVSRCPFFLLFFYFWVSLGGGCLFCVCVGGGGGGGGGESTLICYSFSYWCDIIIHQLLFFFSFFSSFYLSFVSFLSVSLCLSFSFPHRYSLVFHTKEDQSFLYGTHQGSSFRILLFISCPNEGIAASVFFSCMLLFPLTLSGFDEAIKPQAGYVKYVETFSEDREVMSTLVLKNTFVIKAIINKQQNSIRTGSVNVYPLSR